MPTRAALPRSSLAVSRPLAKVVGNARNGSAVELRTEIVPPATPDAPSDNETVIVLPLARDNTAAGPLPSMETDFVTAVELPAESVTTSLSSCAPSTIAPGEIPVVATFGHGTVFVASHAELTVFAVAPSTDS